MICRVRHYLGKSVQAMWASLIYPGTYEEIKTSLDEHVHADGLHSS